MEILFLLIPLSIVLLLAAVWAFVWAVRSGQFEDLEGPAFRVIMDDDDPLIPPPPGQKTTPTTDKTNADQADKTN